MLPDAFRRAGRPLVLGHRGSPKARPENTLDSFELAMAEGADGVELDVLQCATGEIVVIHDPVLTRLGGVDVRVRDASWSFLRNLDVGSHLDSRYAGVRIPRLTDVFDALPSDACVNVELKGDGWHAPAMAHAVARLLLATPHPERLIVSSFDPFLLSAFHAAAPQLPLGWLFAEDQRFGRARAVLAPLLHASALNPALALCTARALRLWQRRGYGLCVWTVDEAPAAQVLAEAGVEVLITNRPKLIRDALTPRDVPPVA